MTKALKGPQAWFFKRRDAAPRNAAEAPTTPPGTSDQGGASGDVAPEAQGDNTALVPTDGGTAATASGTFPAEGPIASLLETMTTLEGVLAEEMDLIATHEPEQMRDVQRRKLQLAAAYEARVKGLSDDPAPLQDLDEVARSALRERMIAFDGVVRRNARAVNAAHAITEELLHKTVDIVKKYRRDNGGYAPDGLRRDESEHTSAPISVDKSL